MHQPNFFPWLGYFDKIARCDVFIVLDNVQFPKKGGTWSNRVRLLANGEALWVTVPVVRAYHGVKPINEIQIDDSSGWRKKLLQTIQTNYGRARHFRESFELVSSCVARDTASLVEFDLAVIREISAALKLDAGKFVLASTLDAAGQATDLLVSLVKAVGGTAYLCGDGAGGYFQDEVVTGAGLELEYQRFAHPVYDQPGAAAFVPGLSVVDALMHVGIAGTAGMLSERREVHPGV